jgi:nucleoside-diphosphate-sugar epimerase
MRILVTGGFGNVGTSVIGALLAKGHEVFIFEQPSARSKKQKRTRELLKNAHNRLGIFYGDITDKKSIQDAISSVGDRGIDAIVHLAAIIPPLSNQKPNLAEEINVGGTNNIIEICKNFTSPPRIVFASSVSIYGDRLVNPWISTTDPLNPNDTYSVTKNKCEILLRESDLPWVVLRLSYVVSSDWLPFDPMLFDVPPSTHFEVVHTEDAGRAFAMACSLSNIEGHTFNIGGGPACRTTYRAYLDRLMRAFGLGNSSFLPDELFAKGDFHCGWFTDSEEAEMLLHFRSKSLEDYYSEVEWRTRFIRPLGTIAAMAVKPWIRSLSPYRAKADLAHSPLTV